jgi:endonuclease III
VATLKAFYGPLPSPPRDPFTLFVWEVLSFHATPRKRDSALESLRRGRALTPDAVWRAPQKTLQEAVALAGPYVEQRLRALKGGVDVFRRAPTLAATIKGPLIGARRALRRLPQMAEGGAYRMLLFATDHPVLPVDASLSRVARRLGYGEAHALFPKTARSIRAAVARELTPAATSYRRAYIYLAHHGSATCTEADPHCRVCPLLSECPYGQKRTGARSRPAD